MQLQLFVCLVIKTHWNFCFYVGNFPYSATVPPLPFPFPLTLPLQLNLCAIDLVQVSEKVLIKQRRNRACVAQSSSSWSHMLRIRDAMCRCRCCCRVRCAFTSILHFGAFVIECVWHAASASQAFSIFQQRRRNAASCQHVLSASRHALQFPFNYTPQSPTALRVN